MKVDENAAELVFQKYKYVRPRLNRAAIGLLCAEYEAARQPAVDDQYRSQVLGQATVTLTRQKYESMLLEIERAKQPVMEWQPIETAPRDALILVYRPGAPEWMQVAPAKWDDQRCHKKPSPYWACWLKIGNTATQSRTHEPTDWTPMPSPPTQTKGG